ncbi:hypothetical protein VTO42DRAFT_6292 [Malbranchea cinnamomea]
MAPEKKDKKRKATSAVSAPSEQPLKKSKKTTTKAVKTSVEGSESAESKTAKAANVIANGSAPKPGVVKSVDSSARQVKPRKRAVDFLSDDEDARDRIEKVKESDSPAGTAKASKDTSKPAKKKARKTAEPESLVTEIAEDRKAKKAKEADTESKDQKAKSISKSTESDVKYASESESEDVSEEDDQTAALIKGFESSDEEEDPSGDEGFQPGQEVPKIPDSKQIKRKLRKMKMREEEPEEPGVVYVSRIPHGFYEHEMRAYFSQFGTITRLRLSRNRTTGRSKHYAFIEFASASVARIVADTMNNYLMFGHILKCKVIPRDQLHPELWKGANRRFKTTPWNKIEKRRLEAGKTRDAWSKKIQQEEKRRQAKAEKMKALGYEMEVPKLKNVDEVPVRENEKGQIEAEQGKARAIEAPTEEKTKKPIEKAEEAPTETTNKKKKKQDNKRSDAPTKAEVDGDKTDNPTPEKKKATGEKRKSESKSKPAAKTTTPEKPAVTKVATAGNLKNRATGSPAVKEKKSERKKNKKAKA